MEIVKYNFLNFLLVVVIFSNLIESTVKNLSCHCGGTQNSHNCPISNSSKWDLNWWESCQFYRSDNCRLKAAVILPKDAESYEASLQKVLPALEIAVKEAKKRRIMPENLKFSFMDYDDQCDSVHGQISAVEAYSNDRPQVIFGPSCEYSVASVARMVKFWNIPLLTAGAMTYDFRKNKTSCENEFHMLVRTGVVDFQHITDFIITVLNRHNWKRAMLIYEKNGYKQISGIHSCKLMMETLVNSLKIKNISFTPFDLDSTKESEFKKILERRELQVDYSGNSNFGIDVV